MKSIRFAKATANLAVTVSCLRPLGVLKVRDSPWNRKRRDHVFAGASKTPGSWSKWFPSSRCHSLSSYIYTSWYISRTKRTFHSVPFWLYRKCKYDMIWPVWNHEIVLRLSKSAACCHFQQLQRSRVLRVPRGCSRRRRNRSASWPKLAVVWRCIFLFWKGDSDYTPIVQDNHHFYYCVLDVFERIHPHLEHSWTLSWSDFIQDWSKAADYKDLNLDMPSHAFIGEWWIFWTSSKTNCGWCPKMFPYRSWVDSSGPNPGLPNKHPSCLGS